MPGILGLNIMSTSLWGLGYALVLNRKRRLLRRFAVTPVGRGRYLAALFFARLTFFFAELALILTAGFLAFDISIQGSVPALIATAVLGAACFGGMGMLIGARIENTETANGWINLSLLPMWIFSGAFFSYERFPEAAIPFIRALPLTALNDALRAIINDTAHWSSLTPQYLVLLAWALLCYGFAVKLFRWQ